MSVAIIDINTLAVVYTYEASLPSYASFGGDWGNSLVTCHMNIPSNIDPNVVSAVKNVDGNIVLIEDPIKVEAKRDTLWSQVRAQQKQKLYESDWTVSAPDAPLNDSQRNDWVAYRQALRDITTQTDPFKIVWPIPPNF